MNLVRKAKTAKIKKKTFLHDGFCLEHKTDQFLHLSFCSISSNFDSVSFVKDYSVLVGRNMIF